MTRIIVSTVVDAPRCQVWDTVSQLDAFVHYHYLLTDSTVISEQARGVGAMRLCRVGDKLAFEEEVLEWVEGESFVVSAEYIKGRGAPVTDYRGTIKLTEQVGSTLVEMITEYLAPNFLIAILDVLLIKRSFRNITQNIVLGLKHYIETGVPITHEILNQT